MRTLQRHSTKNCGVRNPRPSTGGRTNWQSSVLESDREWLKKTNRDPWEEWITRKEVKPSHKAQKEYIVTYKVIRDACAFAVDSALSGAIEREFLRLVKLWKRETAKYSITQKKILHPAYLRIIGMGSPALPLILNELEKNRGDWYWALMAISGEDFFQPNQTSEEARQAWLKWGKLKGFL